MNLPKTTKIIIFSSAGMVVLVSIIIAIVFVIQKQHHQTIKKIESDLQREIDDEHEAYLDDFISQYPISLQLPIIESKYRIDYGYCETSDNDFCIMITASTEESRQAALEVISGLEYYEEEKYSIEFYYK